MAKAKKQELSIEEKLEQALVPKVEQLYDVPKNWCWVKFGCLATDMADGPFGSNLKTEHYTEKREVRIIQLSNIGENGWREENTKYTTFEHAKTISRSIVKAGDIVIAKMMPAGRAIKVPDEEISYILSSDAIKFVPNKLLNTDYLLYAINSSAFNNQVISETQGITRARTSIGKLKTYAFVLAPLTEQQRIVDRIESIFKKLDNAKELAQNALDSFETRKAAILHSAISGKLTSNWRKEKGLTFDDWEINPLTKICTLKSGTTIPAEQELPIGKIPYLKVADMNHQDNLFEISVSSRYVDDYNENHLIPVGSIIFPKRGGAILTNKRRIVMKSPILADLNIMAIIPNDEYINSRYCYYWFLTIDLKELNNGSNVPQINNKDMIPLMIPTPSLYEQLEIVRILDALFEKEQQAKELFNIIDKIDLMKKAILARAFRGELGTNDPNEESAIELLKEVLAKEL